MHPLSNDRPVRATEYNYSSWRRKYPRHAWCLEKMQESSPDHQQLASQFIEKIVGIGKLGGQSMTYLWEIANHFEKRLRELNEKSSGSS